MNKLPVMQAKSLICLTQRDAIYSMNSATIPATITDSEVATVCVEPEVVTWAGAEPVVLGEALPEMGDTSVGVLLPPVGAAMGATLEPALAGETAEVAAEPGADDAVGWATAAGGVPAARITDCVADGPGAGWLTSCNWGTATWVE